MRGWSWVSGRRVPVALAVALLAGVSLSAGSAYASKTSHTVSVESASPVTGFFCGNSAATPGFGTAQFIQNGNALTVKFELVNGPANTSFAVEITECFDPNDYVTHNLGTVTTNNKGQVKGAFSTDIESGVGSYFLCLDGGRAGDWGTQPVPVS